MQDGQLWWSEVNFGAPGLIGGAAKGAPAVIVIQEWWGVTDEVKAHALKIGKEGGYRVLIPDIYKGKKGVDVEEAHHLMSNLDFPAAVKEITAAAAYLKQEGAPAVGITGFCMGGALTLGALAASPDLKCGAPFYGVNFGLFESAQLATKPVQGHFGEKDALEGFSDPPTAQKLLADLRAVGNAAAEVFIYPGVGAHAAPPTVPPRTPSHQRRTNAPPRPRPALSVRARWHGVRQGGPGGTF
jgi:carboxymethylenebutenolidase